MGQPPPSSRPAENAAKWRGLDPHMRDRLLRDRPALVGGRDGLPARVRDQANRAVLDEYLQSNQDPGSAALRDMIDDPTDDARDRPLLLNYKPPSKEGATDGLVAVSWGDPDLARQTAVAVPGTRSNLTNVARMRHGLDKVRRLREQADTLTGEGNTAAIYWLGCKMPDKIATQAISKSYAQKGHPALTRFLSGLRAARPDTEPAWTTVIGHSYGSIVTAQAAVAATKGFPADAIVFEGSPGIGNVPDVRSLNLENPENVYVEASPHDPFVNLPSVVHGVNPRDRKFGAQSLETGKLGHNEYWDHGTPALANKAYVVCGLTDRLERSPQMLKPREVGRVLMEVNRGKSHSQAPPHIYSKPPHKGPEESEPSPD